MNIFTSIGKKIKALVQFLFGLLILCIVGMWLFIGGTVLAIIMGTLFLLFIISMFFAILFD